MTEHKPDDARGMSLSIVRAGAIAHAIGGVSLLMFMLFLTVTA